MRNYYVNVKLGDTVLLGVVKNMPSASYTCFRLMHLFNIRRYREGDYIEAVDSPIQPIDSYRLDSEDLNSL